MLGPILVVPYRVQATAPVWSGGQLIPATTARRYAHIVPQRLVVDAKLSPERRRRGLFGAVVYGASVALTGNLQRARSRRSHACGCADFVGGKRRGRRCERPARVEHRPHCTGAMPTSSRKSPNGASCGFSFPELVTATAPSPGQTLAFSTRLDLRGTSGFHVVPAARALTLDIARALDDAELHRCRAPDELDGHGSWLRRAMARWWSAGRVARRCPDDLLRPGDSAMTQNVQQQDGVDLLEALPTYRMVSRTAKYVLLFLIVGFLTYFLFETSFQYHPPHAIRADRPVCLPVRSVAGCRRAVGLRSRLLIASGAVVLQASLFRGRGARRARLAALSPRCIPAV